MNVRNESERPVGFSSKVTKLDENGSVWIASNGQTVPLPLLIDHVNICAQTSRCTSVVEAIVDLVNGQPSLVDVKLKGFPELDTVLLQRFFRWSTPVEIVTLLIPRLMEQGVDPFSHWLPTDGFPDAAYTNKKYNQRVSDEFLTEIARQYVEIGRGYAKTIARQKGVKERTVVSWIEKARKRGILEQTKPGKRSQKINDPANDIKSIPRD